MDDILFILGFFFSKLSKSSKVSSMVERIDNLLQNDN